MPLTVAAVTNASPKQKQFTPSDAEGLFLLVTQRLNAPALEVPR